MRFSIKSFLFFNVEKDLFRPIFPNILVWMCAGDVVRACAELGQNRSKTFYVGTVANSKYVVWGETRQKIWHE